MGSDFLKGNSMNFIVYDNRLNNTSDLAKLSPVKQNIAYAIFQRLSATRADSVSVSLAEIRELSEVSGNKRGGPYLQLLNSVAEKLVQMSIHYTMQSGREVYAPLFKVCYVEPDTGTIEVRTNEEAEPFFYDLRHSFSRFQLKRIVGLRHKHSKTLFRLFLMGFTGKLELTPAEIKEHFAIKTYSSYKQFIAHLPEYLDELRQSGQFESVSEFELERGRTRGAPIKAFVFHYKISPTAVLEAAGQQKLALPVTDQVKIGHEEEVMGPLGLPTLKRVTKTVERERKCPKCGKSTVIRCTNQKGKPYLCCAGGKYDNTTQDKTNPCAYFEWVEEKATPED